VPGSPHRSHPISNLYDTDIAAWAEQQADALGRRAANETDWDNALGRSRTWATTSSARLPRIWSQAILHDLKAEAWPPDTA